MKHDDTSPGQGTDKGAPKDEATKKGITIFSDVLRFRGLDFLITSLLLFVFALPTAAAYMLIFVFEYFGDAGSYFFIIAAVTAIPVGSALTAYIYCITEFMRGKTGVRVLSVFFHKFKESFKKSTIPGILYTLFYVGLIMLLSNLFTNPVVFSIGISIPLFAMITIAPVFIGLFMPYIFMLMGYINTKMSHILMFTILLALTNIGRSFAGVLLGHVAYAVFILFLPDSLPLTPLLLLWIPLSWLITLIWTWPAVDKQFSITKKLGI